MRRIGMILLGIFVALFVGCSKENTIDEKNCWSCGEIISAAASFCEHCGSSLDEGQVEMTTSATEEASSSGRTTATQNSENIQPPVETQATTVAHAPDHEHSYVTDTVAATCTDVGYTYYWCVCGDFYVKDEVPAKGHSYTKKVTDPTCIKKGYITYECSCGESYIGDSTPAKGHSYIRKVTDPTCTQEGYTTYACSCGEFYVDDYTEPAHKYNNQKCIGCGLIAPEKTYEYLLNWYNQNKTVGATDTWSCPCNRHYGHNGDVCSICNDPRPIIIKKYDGYYDYYLGYNEEQGSLYIAQQFYLKKNNNVYYRSAFVYFKGDGKNFAYDFSSYDGAYGSGLTGTIDGTEYCGDELDYESYRGYREYVADNLDVANDMFDNILEVFSDYLEDNISEVTLENIGFQNY